MTFRDLYDLGEARRRSEESLTQQGRSANFHMPWMNAMVDLIQTDLLGGEIGAAEMRWRGIWEEVLATPAWERWFLGGKLAAFRAEIALQTESPEAAAEWAQKAIAMARVVGRRKYEAAARVVLGKSLVAMGRVQDAVPELQAAVAAADELGSPAFRWRSRAELAAGQLADRDELAAALSIRAAAGIIREIEAGLALERAGRFVAVPQVAEVLRAAG
jgi:hypothetical protein